MTKIQLINEICKLKPEYEDKRGKLHYMTRDELEKLLERIKRKL